MKLADVTVENHSAGVQGTNGFTIAQTSKMFKILSDSLYSDKIQSFVNYLQMQMMHTFQQEHNHSGNLPVLAILTLPSEIMYGQVNKIWKNCTQQC